MKSLDHCRAHSAATTAPPCASARASNASCTRSSRRWASWRSAASSARSSSVPATRSVTAEHSSRHRTFSTNSDPIHPLQLLLIFSSPNALVHSTLLCLKVYSFVLLISWFPSESNNSTVRVIQIRYWTWILDGNYYAFLSRNCYFMLNLVHNRF